MITDDAHRKSISLIDRINHIKDKKLTSSDNNSLVDPLMDDEILNLFSKGSGLSNESIHALYDEKIYHSSKFFKNEFKNLIHSDSSFRPSFIFLSFLQKIFCSQIENSLTEIKKITQDMASVEENLVRNVYLKRVDNVLSEMCLDTVVYEINLFVSEGIIELENLDNVFGQFQEISESVDFLSYFVNKYPVLIKRVSKRFTLIYSSVIKTFLRLEKDFILLSNHFFSNSNHVSVTDVSSCEGDSHNGGESVAIISFSNGEKVVYKPRDLSPEVAFQKYISWINLESNFRLKISKCLFMGEEYGWMEYIEHKCLSKNTEVKNYCKNYGALLAMLDSVGGTDIHFENLICNGESPVIVDLETIFHPDKFVETHSDGDNFLMNLEFYVDSIFFTAMVDPVFFDSNLNGSPLRPPYPKDKTPIFDIEDKKVIYSGQKSDEKRSHCLFYNSAYINPYEHKKYIVEGFKECYGKILSKKNILVTEKFNSWFKNIKVRVLINDTFEYTSILRALNSPYSSMNSLNFETLLHENWKRARRQPALKNLIAKEFEDFYNNDVPYFSAKIDSKSLITSQGDVIQNVLQDSPYERVLNRFVMKSFSKVDQDITCLNYSFLKKAQEFDSRYNERPKISDIGVDYNSLYSLINDQLIFEEGYLIMSSLQYTEGNTVGHTSLRNDFYTGAAGICFSLGYFGFNNNCEKSKENCFRLMEHIINSTDIDNEKSIGLCNGLSGIVYLSTHLGSLYGSTYYLKYAKLLCDVIMTKYQKDRFFDIFSGASGAILAMVSLFKTTKDLEVLSYINTLSFYIISNSSKSKKGRFWSSSIPSEGPTTGLAHGVSGIALSLLRAYEVSENEAFLNAALDCHTFLKAHFSTEVNSWFEDSSCSDENHFEAWCHGAPGIVLLYKEFEKFPQLKYELPNVIRNTLVNSFDFSNDSLCHGSLGNIESSINTIENENQIEIDKVLARIAERGALCGSKKKHHCLSLFNGFSGIAYQLARLNNPGKYPSILTFAAP